MERLLNYSNLDNLGGFRGLAEELLEQQDSISLVAAAIQLLTLRTTEVPIELTAEQPIRVKKSTYRDNNSDRRRKFLRPTGEDATLA